MFASKPPSEREVAFSKKMTEGACVYDKGYTPFGYAYRRSARGASARAVK